MSAKSNIAMQPVAAEALVPAGDRRSEISMSVGEKNSRTLSDVIILPASAEDIPRIADIYAYHVRNGLATFETDPPSLKEMTERRVELRAHGFPYLVAFRNDRLIGYAYAGPYRQRWAYRFTVEDAIYMHPMYVGKGIGRLLLDALIHECELRGYRQIIAVIGDSANKASINVHARSGFAGVGVFRSVGFKHGRWVDTVLMQRSLGAADPAPP